MAEKEDRNTAVECELCATTVLVRTDHLGFWICPRCRMEIININPDREESHGEHHRA